MLIAFLVLFADPVLAQDRALPESREQIQLSYAPLVRQVAPAVVNIYTSRTVERAVHPFMADPFFSQLFRHNLFGNRLRRQVENALGSGLIVRPDGLVVTNAHVIRGADEITVILSDGREYTADLILLDEASDLALMQMQTDGENLPFARLRPSESLEVGDIVLAIGNPFGVGQTVTSGIVSALARSSLNVNDFNFFIQTDAAINPGNSGGPLVALDGGVVGINTAIYSRDGGSLGLGFAIPSEMVVSVMAAAERGESGEGGIQRPWLGVTAQSVSADIAESLGLDRPQGALVTDLHSASPLKEAGLKIGDVIISVDDRTIRDAAEMKFRMATVPLGQTTIFTYLRNDQERTAAVKAMTAPEVPPRNTTDLDGPHVLQGATIANINPAVANELGMRSDVTAGVVVIEVKPRSPASRLVESGDIILEMNGRDINEVKDLKEAIRQTGGRISMRIESNGRVRRIVIRS